MPQVKTRRLAVAAMAAGTIAAIGTGTSASASAATPDMPAPRAAAAAPAHAAPTATASTTCRNAKSKITGSTVTARICWSGKKVWVTGVMYDTKGDHRSACVKVHYVKNVTRTTMRACIKNSKPGKSQKWSDYQAKASRYYIKACTRNTMKTSCDGRWR
ncbi:hypothetical protein AB0C21_12755 [Spirillospora sp. NPDC049024]